MSDFILNYGIEFIFGLVISGLGVSYRKLAVRIKEQDAIKLGVQALLRDRIIKEYNRYIDKGYCPIYGMENVEMLYLQYRTLGGNGTVSKLVDRLKELPTEGE